MELPNIAAYAYQDVHVWSALLTCLRPSTCLCRYVWYVSGTRAMRWGHPPAFGESRALRPAVCGILGLSKALHLPLGQGQGQGQPGLGARPCVELSKLGK